MVYAVYIRSAKDRPWILIGFGNNKEEAKVKGEKRLEVHSKGAEWNFKRFKEKQNAPERLNKLR